jgi:uncharacterized protein (DUF433 family)
MDAKMRKHVERIESFFRAVDQDPEVHSGDLVFKGTRVPVETLMDILRHGGTMHEFFEGYPTVERWQAEAVIEAWRIYAEAMARGTEQMGAEEDVDVLGIADEIPDATADPFGLRAMPDEELLGEYEVAVDRRDAMLREIDRRGIRAKMGPWT